MMDPANGCGLRRLEPERLTANDALWRMGQAQGTQRVAVPQFHRLQNRGEQVKAVASALRASLIVTSHDYYRRFLSYLAHEDGGASPPQGLACPIVLVNASVGPKAFGTGAVPLSRHSRPLDVAA